MFNDRKECPDIPSNTSFEGPNLSDSLGARLRKKLHLPNNPPRIYKEHPNIPDEPKLVNQMLSATPNDSTPLPAQIKNTKVYLRSECIWTLNQETGRDLDTDPCYQIEFHAGILEGDFTGLPVIVTKFFDPPVINPCKSVHLSIGMVVQVSGKLTAQRPKNSPTGLPSFFHIKAKVIKRDITDSEARNPFHQVNTAEIGEFVC